MNGAGRFSRVCSSRGILSYALGLWVLEKSEFVAREAEARREGVAANGREGREEEWDR